MQGVYLMFKGMNKAGKDQTRHWVRVEIVGGKAEDIGQLGRVLFVGDRPERRVNCDGWQQWGGAKRNAFLLVTFDSGWSKPVHRNNVKYLHELEVLVEELDRPAPPPRLEAVDENTVWEGWKQPSPKKRERKPDDPPRLEDL